MQQGGGGGGGGSRGVHSLLGQTESFNYPQGVCTVAYRVGYSPCMLFNFVLQL